MTNVRTVPPAASTVNAHDALTSPVEVPSSAAPAAVAPVAAHSPGDFDALPLRRRATWIVLLGSLTALGAFTVDLYLPAFPSLEHQFATSASAVQLTLTGSLLGVALGQLVVGPLSDALGRRRPLVAGLGLHLLASLLCAVAPSIAVLGVLRVLQGVGVAAGSVVAQAVVRDRFAGHGAARLFARLMIVIGVSPVLAPTVGSALLGAVQWRGIFVVLGLLSLSLGIAVAAVLPETLPPARRRTPGVRSVAAAYREVLRDRAVLGLLVVAGSLMAAIFGYVANSSFVFQQHFHLSGAWFGVLFAVGGACMVAGSQVNGSLVHRISNRRMLMTAVPASAACAAVLSLLALTGTGGVVGLVLPLWATMFFIGASTPNSPVLALERHPRATGTTAAVVGATQNGVAAAAAPLASALGLAPLTGLAVTMTVALGVGLVALVLVVRPGLAVPAHHAGARRPAVARRVLGAARVHLPRPRPAGRRDAPTTSTRARGAGRRLPRRDRAR